MYAIWVLFFVLTLRNAPNLIGAYDNCVCKSPKSAQNHAKNATKTFFSEDDTLDLPTGATKMGSCTGGYANIYDYYGKKVGSMGCGDKISKDKGSIFDKITNSVDDLVNCERPNCEQSLWSILFLSASFIAICSCRSFVSLSVISGFLSLQINEGGVSLTQNHMATIGYVVFAIAFGHFLLWFAKNSRMFVQKVTESIEKAPHNTLLSTETNKKSRDSRGRYK